MIAVNNNFLGTFKSILRQCNVATNIMNRVIVNGEHTDLWFDPWINHKSLVDLIGWNRVSLSNSVNNKVSLIKSYVQLQLQPLLETRDVSLEILQVQPSTDDFSDYRTITNHQKFVFTSVYEKIRLHAAKDDNYLLIWHNMTAGKISFTTFLPTYNIFRLLIDW